MDRIIIDCATELFRNRGLKFQLQDISDELHIAKKTIYKYFDSKEAILLSMVDQVFDAIYQEKVIIINSDLSYKDKLSRVLIAMPEVYKSFDFRNISELKTVYPNVYDRVNYQLESNWEPIVELIKSGIDQGIIRPVSIPILKTIIASTINEFINTPVLSENQITYQEGLEELLKIILKGIFYETIE